MAKMIVEKLFKDAPLPKRASPLSSGVDVTFHNLKKVYKHFGGNGEQLVESDDGLKKQMDGPELELQHLERALIGTGIKATVGPGFEIQVRPRSGLALKQGLTICNTPGTVDADYRDEIGIIIVNLSRKAQKIKMGDRIAQLVVVPVEICDIEEGILDDVNRGGGFGSTGK